MCSAVNQVLCWASLCFVSACAGFLLTGLCWSCSIAVVQVSIAGRRLDTGEVVQSDVIHLRDFAGSGKTSDAGAHLTAFLKSSNAGA
jgi:hypothetical protein